MVDFPAVGRYQFVQTSAGLLRGNTVTGQLFRFNGCDWVRITPSNEKPPAHSEDKPMSAEEFLNSDIPKK